MDRAGVECCCVCLVPFKDKLNCFTMLCLQRQQDSWAVLSPYLLHPTEGLTLKTLFKKNPIQENTGLIGSDD